MTIAPEQTASTDVASQTALMARLEDPAVAASLVTLLDHADLIAVLVEGLDGFIARSEVIGNSLLDSVTELRESVAGSDIMGDNGVDLPKLVDTAKRLSTSDVVGPAALDQLSVLARGMVKGGEQFEARPVEVGGALSLLKLLKDPDINRALSYFATVAKAIGQEINTAPKTSKSSKTSK